MPHQLDWKGGARAWESVFLESPPPNCPGTRQGRKTTACCCCPNRFRGFFWEYSLKSLCVSGIINSLSRSFSLVRGISCFSLFRSLRGWEKHIFFSLVFLSWKPLVGAEHRHTGTYFRRSRTAPHTLSPPHYPHPSSGETHLIPPPSHYHCNVQNDIMPKRRGS